MSAPLQRDSVRRTLSHDVSRCTRPRDGSSTSCEVTYASASAHLNCAFEQTLHRSVAYNTTEAHDFAGRLDCAGSAMRAFYHIKMQASTTTLLCEFDQQRDLSRPVASRASKVLGPISRHCATQVLLPTRCASRHNRHGLCCVEG